MPVYEYACTACGERLEVRQGFDDPPIEECSYCGGKLRKLYSPVGIVFKGSGFYATDTRKPAEPATSPAAKSDGSAKKDSKSDAKGGGKEKSPQ